jgi:hypothetical protein
MSCWPSAVRRPRLTCAQSGAVSGRSRSRLRRLHAAISATGCVAALSWAGQASAAVTVGQLPASPQSPSAACPANRDYLQPSVTGSNLYIARQAGTITSWSTNVAGAGGQSYAFKVFRRTSDPDVFQVVGQTAEQTLGSGLNSFPASVQVESGDMIGLHVDGGPQNSCVFPMPGDALLQSQSPGDLAIGQSAQFAPVLDHRLNLSAVLAPRNAFTITGISRNRRNGTARVSANLSNPGLVTVGGKGLKARQATRAVAGSVMLKVAPTGKRSRKLSRTGRLRMPVTVTFYPTGGDPAAQTITVKLLRKRQPAAL